MKPLISVCIPSYNNSAYIKETINSVLDQTYSRFELIVVDDCSTDNTRELIQAFSDVRIRFYKNEKNLGMHGNWSKALSLATGDFIKLICGDDIIYPDCLETQLAGFENDRSEKAVMVACRRNIIKANGKIVLHSFYKLRPGYYQGKDAVRRCVLLGTNMIGEPMSVLFRSSVFRQNNIQLGSNNYLIDLDLYAKFLKHGNLIVLKEYLAAFRIYSSSMTGSLGLKHARLFSEFIYGEALSRDFELTWYQKWIGRSLSYMLTMARNVVLRLTQ